jgi:hypothetical protein
LTPDQRNIVLAYKKVFSSIEGQLVLEDLKRLAKHGQSPNFIDANGRTDPMAYFRQEGQKVVIRHIIRKIDTDFDKPEQKAISDERIEP